MEVFILCGGFGTRLDHQSKLIAKPMVRIGKEPILYYIMENWEIKDRLYILRNNKKPIIFSLAGKHSSKAPLLWFDNENGVQRELKYATNQNSPFVDEQKGETTLGRIVFRDGQLQVPKENQCLQKLLLAYR